MLTADLVRARRYQGELRLQALDAKGRAHAEDTAAALIAVAEAHVGQRRDGFDEACAVVVAAAHDPRVAAGLVKLTDDRATFALEAAADPEALRRDVFVRASTARRTLAVGACFDRDAVLAAVGAERGLDAATVDRMLYADLSGAHLLTGFASLSPAALVTAYEDGQAQAVLLRAVRVVVEVECASPGAYRLLFRRLKFQRLLHSIAPRDGGGYRIEIDGPFSLFESVTRYGLALALALPAVRECDTWTLEADLRWGPSREPLRFKLAGGAAPGAEPARLPDDVAALVAGIAALAGPWQARPADVLLDLPGVGVCAPDLMFRHGDTGECVYLEVLGYWSRPAVWKRVELVQQGLTERVVFAVGKHLRVSEEALDDDLPGALYVYKRTMSPRAVIERVEALTRVEVRTRPTATPVAAAAKARVATLPAQPVARTKAPAVSAAKPAPAVSAAKPAPTARPRKRAAPPAE